MRAMRHRPLPRSRRTPPTSEGRHGRLSKSRTVARRTHDTVEKGNGMRYLVFVKMREDVGPPAPALVAAMGAEMQAAFSEGWMLDAGGLYPTDQSTEITLRSGTIEVTDGPFAETKEVVGGYAMVEVRSHEEA